MPILDPLKLIEKPVLKLHHGIHKRTEQYQHLVSMVANRVICGLGARGYPLGARAPWPTKLAAARATR